jgi:hypothetical protein
MVLEFRDSMERAYVCHELVLSLACSNWPIERRKDEAERCEIILLFT